MIGDQDVFGLRTIRVPAQHHGIVEELVRADTEASAATFFDNGRCNFWIFISIDCSSPRKDQNIHTVVGLYLLKWLESKAFDMH